MLSTRASKSDLCKREYVSCAFTRCVWQSLFGSLRQSLGQDQVRTRSTVHHSVPRFDCDAGESPAYAGPRGDLGCFSKLTAARRRVSRPPARTFAGSLSTVPEPHLASVDSRSPPGCIVRARFGHGSCPLAGHAGPAPVRPQCNRP